MCSAGTHFSPALPYLCQYAFQFMPTCLEAYFEDDTFLIFAEKSVRRITTVRHSRLMESHAQNWLAVQLSFLVTTYHETWTP